MFLGIEILRTNYVYVEYDYNIQLHWTWAFKSIHPYQFICFYGSQYCASFLCLCQQQALCFPVVCPAIVRLMSICKHLFCVMLYLFAW